MPLPLLGGALALGGTKLGAGLLSSGGVSSAISGISNILGSSGLGSVSNLLTGQVGSLVSNPIGSVSNLVGGLFGGSDNSYINATREDVVLGNGTTPLAILYNHPQKTGGRIIITEPMDVNDMFFDGKNWHDCVSAVDIANNASITWYEHPNYGGLFEGINGNNMQAISNPNSSRPGSQNSVNLFESWKFWNDRISSFKVTGKATYQQNTNKSTLNNTLNNNSSTISANQVLNNTQNNNVVDDTKTTETKNNTIMYFIIVAVVLFLFKDKLKF